MAIKPIYILAAVIVIAVVIGAVYFLIGRTSAQVVVASGDTVSVYYTGTLTNGTVFDSNVGKQPLQFTVGSSQIISGFSNGVIGMKINQTKRIVLATNEAYGPVNPNLIIQVSLQRFGNQTINKGMAISETNNGEQLEGIVTAVNSTTATINFNPPLAGQTLIFNITVVGINQTK